MLSYKDLYEWIKAKYSNTANQKIYENLEDIPEIQTLLSPEGEKKFEFKIDPRLPIDLILEEQREVTVDEKGTRYPIDILKRQPNNKKKNLTKKKI